MTPDFVMVRLPRHLADAIDAVKGDVPRERWVRRRLEEALGVAGTEGSRDALPSGPASPRQSGLPSLGDTWRR